MMIIISKEKLKIAMMLLHYHLFDVVLNNFHQKLATREMRGRIATLILKNFH